MSASQTLLVFETNPESLDFYLVDLESKQAAAARLIAGLRVGIDDLSDRQHRAFTALNEWFASDAGKAAEQGILIQGVNIKEVIYFGIVL